jgi:RNA polymerase sigma factor (sigma-70 family)
MPPRSALTVARLVPAPDPAPPDVPLLRAFVSGVEGAFEELVRRHGPMVLAVCRRVLGNAHDAEDAFQAVFLVLARKAGTVRGNLAAWLYGVAVRTARGVRVMRDRRRKHELASGGRQVGGGSEQPAYAGRSPVDHDLAAVIDEELAKLPEHYRAPVVLCELRGLSRRQAAAELGIPEGTLSSRLAAAKRKLAALLSARGLSAPAVLVPLFAPAAVSAGLLRAAVSVTRGAAGPVASAAAGVVMKGMLFEQLKAVVVAAGILLTVVCGGLAMTGVPGGSQPATAPAPRAASDPAAKLVEQLGAPEFADREEAARKLREMGLKAEAALRSALRSENPEVRDRAAKLLTAVRADSRNALAKAFKPDDADEPDHPVWKRFKTIAGGDAAARKLFAEIIADPRRLKLLDDAERDPDKAGELYAKEVKDHYALVEWRNPWGAAPPPPRRPWADEVVILYLGTYPASSGKFPNDSVPGDRLEVHLFWSWDEALKAPAAPAARRVFAAWLALRANPETLHSSLDKVGRDRIAEALPLVRKLLADEAAAPVRRAHAALLVGLLGTRDDVALLRRVAESPAAAEPFEKWNVVVKGQSELDALWGRMRFGVKVDPEEAKRIWAAADIRRGDRTIADCAWAAAVKLAGGKPEEMGFRSPLALTTGKVTEDWFYSVPSHGFPDGLTRLLAHTAARLFLDEKAKESKEDEPKPDPAAVKLVEQLGAADFKEREEAAKKLREMGTKAEAALKAGLKSENPEIRDRAAKVLGEIRRDQLRDVFAKVAGDDKAARELFTHITSSPRAMAALKAALDDPAQADELYRTRTAELMRIAAGHPPVDADGKASVPTTPGNVRNVPTPPLGDVAGWLFLGSLQSGKAKWREVTHEGWENSLSSHVPFLPEDDYTSAKPIAAAYTGELAGPLKKLTAAWLAKRRENDMLRAGFALAVRYDITDAVAAARVVLKEPKPADVRPWNLAAAAISLALHGGKDDLPLLARHAADDRNYANFLNLPKDFKPVGAVKPKEGRDLFCNVRDAVVVSMCKLAGKDPADFGFPPFPKTKHPSGAPMSLSSATRVGFSSKADREKAFEKAAEWLKSFEAKGEPKKDEPDPAAVRWVEQLGAPDFNDREEAQKALRELGPRAEAALRDGLRSEEPEVRERAAKLLTTIRADVRDALAKSFKPDGTDEPDHPVWRRFKSVVGNDAAARKLFADIIADPRRLQLLDEAERDPDAAGDLYVTEVARWCAHVRRLWPDPGPRDTPYPEAVAVMYLGTYPASAGKATGVRREGNVSREGWQREGNLFVESWYGVLKSPVGPAVKRVFAAWLPLRTDPEICERSLAVAARGRVKEALPFARKILADERQDSESRAYAALVLGVLGTRDDLPLLRRVAESQRASGPFLHYTAFRNRPAGLIGPREPSPWADVPWDRLGVERLDWNQTVADFTWAAAVRLAGGKPADMGFLWPRTITGVTIDDDWFSHLQSHGFPDDETRDATGAVSRAAAHAKARKWLDERKEKDGTFEEQVKKAEAEVKKLGLAEVQTTTDGVSTEKPIRFDGKAGEVVVKPGTAVLVELPKATREMAWRWGDITEAIGDQDADEFTHVLCTWTEKGKLTWVMYKPKDDPEPAGTGAKVWPHFKKLVGDDKDSRALFDLIVKNPKNLELLEKAAAGDPDLLKLYRTRRDELNKASDKPHPTDPNKGITVAVPLDEIFGWLLLGTYAGTKGDETGSVPFFLYTEYAQKDLADALAKDPTAKPLRKLVVAWLENRGTEPSALRAGLNLALRCEVSGAVPTARRVLKDIPIPKPGRGPQGFSAVGTIADLRATALLVLGKYGTDDDFAVLKTFADDTTPLEQPNWGRHPDDAMTEMRDVALAMMIHMRGGKVHEFGFLRDIRVRSKDGRLVPVLDPVRPDHIGFLTAADRAAGHKKAREWLEQKEKQEKKEKKDPTPEELVKQLGAPEFADREAATEALLEIGEPALAALRAAARDENPEVRRRAADLVKAIESPNYGLVRTLTTPAGVCTVAFTPKGEQLLTGSLNGTVCVWETPTGRKLTDVAVGSEGIGEYRLAALPNGKGAVLRYARYDLDPVKFRFGFEGHTAPILPIAVSSDGKWVLTGSADGTARLWESDTGTERRKIEAHMGKRIEPPPTTGRGEPAERFEGRGVRDAAFSRDDTRIVTGGNDGAVRVWNADDGTEVRSFATGEEAVLAVAFLPDRDRVVSAGTGGVIRVWDAKTGKEAKRLTGHAGVVYDVAVSPDGKRLVSAGLDKTVRVWDVETGTQLRCFRGHTHWVYAVAVAPDGRTAVSGGEDQTARVWRMPK